MISNNTNFGISAIGLAIPKLALPLTELAKLHEIDPDKYTKGLGCHLMSLCAPDETVVTLAVKAAQRAIENWGKDPQDLGLIITATESAIDFSRPLSSWVMSALKLKGPIRSYEVKHACYGGTAAVRQALEWKLSGNSKGKAALVICVDVALYAPEHSGEPTQGAGSAALIIDTPAIASINNQSFYWSDPQFDFWRPIDARYPEVNGRLSLMCYMNAAVQCFNQLAPVEQLANYLREFNYLAFHVPFPDMVHRAVRKVGESAAITAEEIEELYLHKVLPCMEWNQIIGNSYTASLWFAIGNALTKLQAAQQMTAFSYGSGSGAELLTLQCTVNQSDAAWVKQLADDFANRKIIDAKQYLDLRS